MGLLDDAIREHLELKRLHGAEAEELSRLEQEAFSPPSRPGDPDFGPEPGTGDNPEAVAAELFEQGAEPATEGGGPAELTGTELGRVAHAGLDDTVPHPVTDEEDAADPPEAPESAIFDADEELDLDLDLDLEGDLDLESPPASPAPSKESGDDFLAGADFESAFDLDPPPDRPVEPAPLPEDKPPTGEAPVPMLPAEEAEEVVEPEAPPAGGEPGEPEGDDLLEETPEFLKDAPDGESLWFEQGKPEDFDFDDD